MSQERRSVLSSEVSTLRQSCNQLEKSMMELQGNLETKNASLASLGNDLKVAEEQYNRLMAKVEEMQNTVSTRDNTGEYVTETRPRETRGGRGRLFSLKRLCFCWVFLQFRICASRWRLSRTSTNRFSWSAARCRAD